MINNYKAQRNVRAELDGAVNLGHPVALYIKEDEVAVASKNLIINGKYNVDADPLWLTGTDTNGVEGWSISGGKATKSAPAANSGIEQSNIFENGKTYQVNFTISDRTQGSIAVYRGQGTQLIYSSGSSSMNDSHSIIITSTTNAHKILFNGTGNFDGSIDNVSVYEVLDHTYKLMAINDTIPSGGINVEAVGSELGTNGTFESNADNWVAKSTTLAHETSAPITGSGSIKSTNSAASGGPYQNMGLDSTKNYKVTGKMKLLSGSSNGRVTIYTSRSNGTGQEGAYEGSAGELVVGGSEVSFDVVISPTESDRVSIQFAVQVADGVFLLDDVSVKEVYGYDYYNAPAYKFGIVSSVYDQSTGAMKTSGVAGDEVDVTVQGECNLIRPSGNNVSVVKDYVITKIGVTGNPTDSNPATEVDGGHQNIPNSVGVITETNSSSETAKAILWQGVEFSEHFVHKNSLQVMAKCDETITKFRPVSLFLDSNGDLLCRHDDIPEEQVLLNTDYTGVDPGKWGVAELGGVSGELIPVTVAGKTTFKTDNSVPYRNAGDLITRLSEGGWLATTTTIAGFAPNALGTVMEGGGAGDEVPITIFQGTPIGTITDWKRTIKVTAKARGTVPQYRPVSLYLDENGNYRCTVDGIPRTSTDSNNGVWCDFRKWGIAQEAAVDGENVEIIVQGRTRVKDTSTNANRGEFVTKISSSGDVTSGDALGLALSSLGIIEKESKLSDGEPGVIIIF